MKKHLFTRVGYSYLPVTNIDESIEWYVKHMELRLVQKLEDRGSNIAVLQFPHKNAIALVLVETNKSSVLEINRNGSSFPVMAINCPDIEHTYNRFKDKDVRIEKELTPLGTGEASFFYFRDCNGNLLEAAWSIWDPKDEIKDEFLE